MPSRQATAPQTWPRLFGVTEQLRRRAIQSGQQGIRQMTRIRPRELSPAYNALLESCRVLWRALWPFNGGLRRATVTEQC
jgi:hypothetical protein